MLVVLRIIVLSIPVSASLPLVQPIVIELEVILLVVKEVGGNGSVMSAVELLSVYINISSQ
jgi:hypothetical protein